MDVLEQACLLLGGPARLARALQVSPQTLNNWKRRRRIPADQIMAVETVTAGRNPGSLASGSIDLCGW